MAIMKLYISRNSQDTADVRLTKKEAESLLASIEEQANYKPKKGQKK
jgi:hypothetical protein